MRGRRNYRNYRGSQRKKAKLDFTPVIIILCLAVGCGYAAAKYVVDPVVNYVPELIAGQQEKESAPAEKSDGDGSAEKEEESSKSSETVIEDEAEVEEKGEIKGYALQYGCYSSEKAADTAMKSLSAEDLQIIEQDDMFKITGKIYETKKEAKGVLQKLEDDPGAFVTTIYK